MVRWQDLYPAEKKKLEKLMEPETDTNWFPDGQGSDPIEYDKEAYLAELEAIKEEIREGAKKLREKWKAEGLL